MKKNDFGLFWTKIFFYVLENFQGLIFQFDVGLSMSIVFSFTSYLLGAHFNNSGKGEAISKWA